MFVTLQNGFTVYVQICTMRVRMGVGYAEGIHKGTRVSVIRDIDGRWLLV